jgi:hypothetical protein
MKFYFDEIINNNPIPNGLTLEDDIKNLYIKNYQEFKLYTFLDVPHLPFNKDISYLKLEKTTKGYYPLCLDLSEVNLINPINMKHLFFMGISSLAREKILIDELKLLLFIYKHNKNINQDISTINNTLQQFTTNFNIVKEDKNIKINTLKGNSYQ